MIIINVKNNSDDAFKKALAKFKNLCKNDGFIYELKQRRYFRKPSEIAREKRNKAKRRK
ncbi:MAG: 30S ribosomal protein S21 [Candidatus Helarchaeota archaeon]